MDETIYASVGVLTLIMLEILRLVDPEAYTRLVENCLTIGYQSFADKYMAYSTYREVIED